ncbi:MAG: PGF-pre-PGF domain-containing protein [Euryarchaeota archaeon]|nr:PGF-pre-PGF domain-containing protein [Euryarchaeota archaeon]
MKRLRLATILVVVSVAVLSTGLVGTAAAQTEISNWTDLQGMQDDPTGDYVLANDLDENTDGYETVVGNGGFETIAPVNADVGYDYFKGTFDGQKHTISGLKIDSSGGFSGLFGRTSGSEVKNVVFEGVNVINRDPDRATGGVIGYNDGVVRNVSVSGSVEGGGHTGGIVGENAGTIEDSYATATVSSRSTEYEYAGGLVGQNTGTVEDSYAASDVSGGNDAGGVVGFNSGGEVRTSYWDTSLTSGSSGGTGLSTEEMTGADAPENMGGFAFTDRWHATDSYPVFAWQNTEPYFGVTIENTNSPVEIGDTLTATASVTNWGADGSGTVTLTDTGFENVQRDSTTISPASGVSEDVDLSWTTDSQNNGNGDITVSSGDDEATETVRVIDPVLSLDIDETMPVDPVDGGSANEITLTATYEDAGTGAPIEGEPVSFSAVRASGSLENRDGSTDGNGEATATYVVGDGDWVQPVELSVVLDDDNSVSRAVAFDVGEPEFAINMVADQSEIQPSGEATVTATVTYEAPFAAGNEQEGETVDFSAGTAEGSLGLTDDTNADGTATTTYTPSERDFGDTVTIMGEVDDVTDTAAVDVLDSVVIEAMDSTTTAGDSGELDVTATDGTGALLEGVTIDVTDDGDLDGISTGETYQTNASGVATFSFADEQSRDATLGFAWGEDTGVEATATVRVTPADPAAVVVSSQPDDATAGEPVSNETSGTLAVDIRDAYDNVVDDATDEVTLDIETGDGTLGGDTTVSATDGVATFSDLSIETADDYTLTAAAGGLTEDRSRSFTVSAAAADSFAVDAPDSITAGDSFVLTVNATDEFGNPASGQTLAGFELDSAFDGSVYSSAVELNETGENETRVAARSVTTVNESHTLTASADALGDESIDIRVDPAAVDSLTAPNVTGTAGFPGTLTVNASDAFGNSLADEGINVTDSGGLGRLAAGNTNRTNETGDAAFEFLENTSGTYSVDLVAVGNTTVTTAANVTIEQAAVDSLSASLAEDSLTTGESTTFTANASFINGTTLDRTETANLTSNDSSVASVDANGTVRAESAGRTELKAELGGKNDTVAVSVSNPPRANPARSSSRRTASRTDDAVDIETNDDGSVSATLSASADEPASIDLGAAVSDESGTRYGRVDLTFSEDTEITFEARPTSRDGLPDGTPTLGDTEDGRTDDNGDTSGDPGRAISYVEFTAASDGVDASDRISAATIEFEVSSDTLDDRDLDVDDVVLNRYDEDASEWTELDTEVVSDGDEAVTYESTTPGFSVFAVGERVAETATDETTESTETADNTPGFGLFTAVVALLGVALLVGRRV